ncbi:MAG: LuxR C-terminal-related transcriptional regulator [Candidatus Dormiibacterota bacterium]
MASVKSGAGARARAASPIPLRRSAEALFEQASGYLYGNFDAPTATEFMAAIVESCRQMEMAYRASVNEGDDLWAGRAAMFLFKWTVDPGAARGWEQRSRRHLELHGPCVDQGHLAVARVGCECHSPDELIERAELGLAIGVEYGDHDLELRAMGDKGLGLVSRGQVDEGFALLDEVMMAVTAEEFSDPVQCGLTMCALLTACERSGDRGRAESWSKTIESHSLTVDLQLLNTHCAIVYGAIDAMCGQWDSAEVRLRQAVDASATIPYHSAMSASQLAELRIQQGRYEDADQLLRPVADYFDAAPTLARLRLAEGRYDEASALLRSFARGLGSDLMRLGPTLGLLIDVELRRNDVPGAKRAERRLRSLDEACNSNEIRATARLGSARIALAQGDAETAIDELETGLTLLTHRERPLLAAQVRLELSRALARAGEPESARVEATAAMATFEKLGVAPDIASGRELMEVLGAGREQPAPQPATPRHLTGQVEQLTRREEEVAMLVSEGLSNKEIATRLFLSARTVESHVDRILGKLDFHNRTQLASWMKGQPA